ncbi:unknown [Prevotella sp. CAG:873]|nr:unknown [Prevotella sp. CAG:873]
MCVFGHLCASEGVFDGCGKRIVTIEAMECFGAYAQFLVRVVCLGAMAVIGITVAVVFIGQIVGEGADAAVSRINKGVSQGCGGVGGRQVSQIGISAERADIQCIAPCGGFEHSQRSVKTYQGRVWCGGQSRSGYRRCQRYRRDARGTHGRAVFGLNLAFDNDLSGHILRRGGDDGNGCRHQGGAARLYVL